MSKLNSLFVNLKDFEFNFINKFLNKIMFKFIEILALAASTAQALKVRDSDDKVCTSEFCGDISEKDITTLYVDDTNVCPFTGKNLG